MENNLLPAEWERLAFGPAQSPVSRGYGRLHATVAADPVNRRLSSRFGRSEDG